MKKMKYLQKIFWTKKRKENLNKNFWSGRINRKINLKRNKGKWIKKEKESIPVNQKSWPKGVEEIDHKYHHMVGNNKVKYPAPMNRNCQGASKFALPKQRA